MARFNLENLAVWPLRRAIGPCCTKKVSNELPCSYFKAALLLTLVSEHPLLHSFAVDWELVVFGMASVLISTPTWLVITQGLSAGWAWSTRTPRTSRATWTPWDPRSKWSWRFTCESTHLFLWCSLPIHGHRFMQTADSREPAVNLGSFGIHDLLMFKIRSEFPNTVTRLPESRVSV